MPIVPEPLRSDEEWARYHHKDLGELNNLQLWQEQRRVEWALTWSDPTTEKGRWLLARLTAVHAERGRRRVRAS